MKYIQLIETWQNNNNNPIIDSNISFEQAIQNTQASKDILVDLVLLNVYYISTDQKLHMGQIMVHKDIKDDVSDFFEILLKEKFIVEKVIPVVTYNWNDDTSMENNNSSGFNYRKVMGKNKLSKHSYGKAIDINPLWNPVYYSSGKISPNGAQRDTKRPGTFLSNSKGVLFLKSKGWKWGGDWTSLKDWHHFEK